MSKIEILEYFMAKKQFCDHNLKLASGRQKKNFHFVTIKFYYFCGKKLKLFFGC
jgi:hypothetical protein